MKKNTGFGLTAIFLITLAYAFTGAAAPVGYHIECIDTIDNDGDGEYDSNDPECLEYPFADGNGESHTPEGERFTSSAGYVSTIYDYWYQQLVDGIYKFDPCTLNTPSWYGPGNDGSGTQYDGFALQYCI